MRAAGARRRRRGRPPRRGALMRLLFAAACGLLYEPLAAACLRACPRARVESLACLDEATCGERACYCMRKHGKALCACALA